MGKIAIKSVFGLKLTDSYVHEFLHKNIWTHWIISTGMRVIQIDDKYSDDLCLTRK